MKTYKEHLFPDGSKKFESLEKCACDNREKAALEEAHKIRRFEINLYWRRSLYFWGFQAAFFAVYALIIGNSDEKNKFFVYGAIAIIAALGLFVSILWYFLAIGSKAWQENWENHIDQLEDDFTGRLYKTVLGDEREFYSVTRINQLIICAIGMAWLWLLALPFIYLVKNCFFCGALSSFNDKAILCLTIAVALLIFIVALICLWCKNRHHNKGDSIFRIKSSFPSEGKHEREVKTKGGNKNVYFRWKGIESE